MPTFEVQANGKTYEVDAPSYDAAIKALSAPAQTQRPTDAELQRRVAAGEPLGIGLDDPFARQLTQNFARQNPEEAQYGPQAQAQNALGAKSTEYGAAEGGRLIKAGVQQLGSGIADEFNQFVKGQPYSYDRVTRDDTGKVINREQGLLDNSKQLPMIAKELIRQQVQTEDDRAAGVNIPTRNAAAGAAQIAAATLGPEVALPRATTLIGAMTRNSVTGVLGNALTFDESPSMTKNAIAAGSGPVLGVLTGTLPAAKNRIAQAILKVAGPESRTGQALAKARSLFGDDFKFSLAQQTGVPWIGTMETRSFNSAAREFYANQTDKFIAKAADVLEQPLKPGQNLADDFTAARIKAEDALSNMRRNASKAYEQGIDDVVAKGSRVTQGGAPAKIETPEFADTIQRVNNEQRRRDARGLGAVLPKKYMQTLDAVAANKGAPPAEMADLLRELTSLQQADDPVTAALGSKLREGLERDLDNLNAVRQAGNAPTIPQLDDATKALLDTRAQYRAAKDAERFLSDSASYKLLGVPVKNGQPPDTQDVLQSLHGMSPEKRASVRQFMEKNSPELLTTMKQSAMDEAVRRAGRIAPAGESQKDLERFTKSLFNPAEGDDVRLLGLWNSDELKRLDNIKAGLSVIANNRPALKGAGTVITPEDTAINLVFRHGGFLARYLTRALTASHGADLFFDQDIYKALTTIGRSTTGSPTNLLARASLLDALQTDYTENGQTFENVKPAK